MTRLADLPTGALPNGVCKLVDRTIRENADQLLAMLLRWDTEREEKNLAEYPTMITLPPELVLVRMSKTPLGVVVSPGGGPQRVRIFVTRKRMGWDRLPDEFPPGKMIRRHGRPRRSQKGLRNQMGRNVS